VREPDSATLHRAHARWVTGEIGSSLLQKKFYTTEGILDIDDFFNYQALTPNIKWTPPRAPTVPEINAARDEIMADTGIDIRDICLDPARVYPLH